MKTFIEFVENYESSDINSLFIDFLKACAPKGFFKNNDYAGQMYYTFNFYLKCHAPTLKDAIIKYLKKNPIHMAVQFSSNTITTETGEHIEYDREKNYDIFYDKNKQKPILKSTQHISGKTREKYYEIDFDKNFEAIKWIRQSELKYFQAATKDFLSYIKELPNIKIYYGTTVIKKFEHVSGLLRYILKTVKTNDFDWIQEKDFSQFMGMIDILAHDKNIDDEYLVWMYKIFEKNPTWDTQEWENKFYEFIEMKADSLSYGGL